MSSPKININGFKFGIELESNINTNRIKSALKLEEGWRCHYEHCGSEIVSPILYGYKGLMSVRRHLKKLWAWQKSIRFNDCGLHVHVDIQHFNFGQAKRLVLLASRFDQTLFSMMDGTRWNNNYARRCSYDEKKLNKIKTLYELQTIQKHGERYSGLNLHSFSKHGTAEFRYCTGSANWQKIYALISMYLRMVALSTTDIEIPKVEDIPEWTKDSKSLKNARVSLEALEVNRDIFFDILQLSGSTRDVLVAMFDENVFDITKTKTNLQTTEQVGDVSFFLKEKSKK